VEISILDFAKNAVCDYETKRTDGRPHSIHLVGHPGQAKTDIVSNIVPQILEDYYWPNAPEVEQDWEPNVSWSRGGKVAVYREILSTRESVDVRGFNMPLKNEDTGEYTTYYVCPDIVKTVERLYAQSAEIVILFFDELAQCGYDIQKSISDVLHNGRIGSYAVPKPTWVIGASNYAQDGAGANRLLTILNNRVNTLNVFLPFEAWSTHAREQLGFPDVLLDFADFRKELVFTDAVPLKEGPFPSPRSYTDACHALVTRQRVLDCEFHALDTDAYARAKVAGYISEGAMVELFAFMSELHHLPKLSEIVADPNAAVMPEKVSAQYAAALMLIRETTNENVEALWTYAERLTKDMQVKVAASILAKPVGGKLYNSETFAKWKNSNKALINAAMAQ
jgi:hypothetical protein